MAAFTAKSAGPMAEINTTPLIDVMLVMLIMFIITIPAAMHSTEVDLPSDKPPPIDMPRPDMNRIVLTADGHLLWNGKSIGETQLAALLAQTRKLRPEPELQFQPEAYASYDLSARTIGIIKRSKVSRFGFVGNEAFAEFGREPKVR